MRKYFYETNRTIEIIKYSNNLTIVNILKYENKTETLSTIFYDYDFENTIQKHKDNNLV